MMTQTGTDSAFQMTLDSPPVTGEDGRAAREVVVAIYRAAGTGQPVLRPVEK
jgi:hypothetical protein